MRKAVLFVLLASLLYAGWIYWQRYTDVPLRERLLRFADYEVRSVEVFPWRERAFRLELTEAGAWVITREALQLPAPPRRVDQLIEELTSMRTDSVIRESFPEERIHRLIISNGQAEEHLRLHFSPEGEAWASVGVAQDVFALHPRSVAPIRRALRFDHFRDRRLLDDRSGQANTLRVVFRDSVRQLAHGFSLAGDSCRSFIADFTEPTAEFADNFDEVTQRHNRFATLELSLPGGEEKRVSIYRDTMRASPFVLVSPDFPRRFLARDSLPFKYE